MSTAADALPPIARGRRWRASLSGAGAALSTALADAPEIAVYGLMALAPLGAAFGPVAMMLALGGAVLASAVSSLLGAGRLVTGPRSSLALLTAGLVSSLMANSAAQGDAAAWQIMFMVALGLALAGLLQVLFGLLKLGTIVKFTPHPVRVGLTSGVGLLLMVSALPVALGHGFGAGWKNALLAPHAGALLVGLCAALVSAGATRLRTRLPPGVMALAAAALLDAALMRSGAGWQLGSLIGVPSFPDAWLPQRLLLPGFVAGAWSHLALALVLLYGLTVAVLNSMDTLLAVSVVDGRLRRSRDANRELVAQGLANLTVAVAGGPATSPLIVRSLALLALQADHRHTVLAYAAALALLMVLAPGLLGFLPDSAVGGVLLLHGARMVSPTLWRTPLALLSRRANATPQHDYDESQRRLPTANWRCRSPWR